MAIVIALGLTAAPVGARLLARFAVGGLLLIAGLTLFLLGVDLSVLPVGRGCGAALTKKRNLPLLLASSFLIGFFVTAAEPDMQVLAAQARGVFPSINKFAFVVVTAAGVGVFMTLGLLRSVMRLPLKIFLLSSYALVFILAFLGQKHFSALAFDSGGATTGPMTVPFIMSLGVGVSAVRAEGHGGKNESRSDSFGLTGMASIGPVVALLIYGLAARSQSAETIGAAQAAQASRGALAVFADTLPRAAKDAAASLLPVMALFALFQAALLRLPPRQVRRVIIGFAYCFAGLVIFLDGAAGGFMDAGRALGAALGAKAARSSIWLAALAATGFLIGAVVVCAEPAVWILTNQVESISGGAIKRGALLAFLSAGAAAAVALAMARAVKGFSLMWILAPGYAVAAALMLFCPPLFTAIAFDSGGVASGPISSTFVLSFALGAAEAAGGQSDIFGVIALIAMTPLIAIQTLGIFYSRRQSKNSAQKTIGASGVEAQE